MVPSRGRGRPRGNTRASRGGGNAVVRALLPLPQTKASSEYNHLSTPQNRNLPPRGTFGKFSTRIHPNSSPGEARSKHFSSPLSKGISLLPGSANKIDQLVSSPSTQRATEFRKNSVGDLSSVDAGASTPLSWQTAETTPSGLAVQVAATSTPGSSGRRRGRPPGPGRIFRTPMDAGPRRRGRPFGSTNKPSSLRKSHVPPEDGLRVFVEPSPAKESSCVKTYLDPNDVDDEAEGGAGYHERASSKRPKRWSEDSPPQPSSPVYHVYACEWGSCCAELHNLETLRKHVFKLHANKTGEYACRWQGCEEEDDDAMESVEALKGHLEKAHFVPLAWRLGDGPRTEEGSDGESFASVREIARL